MNKLWLMTLSPLRFHLSILVVMALFGIFLHNSIVIVPRYGICLEF
jgi:hypothetical protein